MTQPTTKFRVFMGESVSLSHWRLCLLQLCVIFSGMVTIKFMFERPWIGLIEPLAVALTLTALFWWMAWRGSERTTNDERPTTNL